VSWNAPTDIAPMLGVALEFAGPAVAIAQVRATLLGWFLAARIDAGRHVQVWRHWQLHGLLRRHLAHGTAGPGGAGHEVTDRRFSIVDETAR
jgi:hypothetical protein